MNYVLITGASRGIGKGIALKLAKAGYNLILTCNKNTALLQEVADTASGYGITVHTFTGDISKPQVCEELFIYIRKKQLTLDAVINNAAVSYVGLLQDMSCQQWDDCLSTNLSSIFYICKLAVPDMIRQHRGRIINISSVWGNVGASCEVAYSATKGGVNALTKALAKELAPSGIQVNAIAFGAMDTDMNSHLSAEDKASLEDEIPMGRMGRTDEAGDMVLSLLSAPDYLTGQVITMDGGWIS